MRNSKGIHQSRTNHEYCISKKNFFAATIKKWNMLDSDIRSSESLNVFKNKVLKFIQPKANSFFNSFINNVLLFGDTSPYDSAKTMILNATINYITSTKRFYGSIFTFWKKQ